MSMSMSSRFQSHKTTKHSNNNNMTTLAHYSRWLVMAIVTITSLTNIIGWPQLVVHEWEDTGFGDRFVPVDCLTVAQKRIVSGIVEFIGLLLIANNKPANRKYGLLLILFMYSRGTFLHIDIGFVETILVGMAALVALVALGHELEVSKPKAI